MSKSICFVVHRYAPFPGGSEYYVQAMAEECVRRGHYVVVLAGEHKGNLNGVRVTSDYDVLLKEPFNLIVIHGSDVHVQNIVLLNAHKINSKLLYMIILPSHSKYSYIGMKDCDYLGYSTSADYNYIREYGFTQKAYYIRHSLPQPIEKCLGKPGFKEKYRIKTKRMFLSSGGYWPNKAMPELANLFSKLDLEDTTLVFTGYANRHMAPIETKNIKSLMIDDRTEIYDAMYEADIYIMHSTQEGFGLVLLEATINRCPWAARRVGGAELLSHIGFVYDNDSQLSDYLLAGNFKPISDSNYNEITSSRQIKDTVDDIEYLLV